MDENDQPMVSGNNFVIDPEKIKEFNDKIAELREEYSETLDAHKERLLEVDKLLGEEIDLEFTKIPIDCFPEGLTQEQYEVLMVFAMD